MPHSKPGRTNWGRVPVSCLRGAGTHTLNPEPVKPPALQAGHVSDLDPVYLTQQCNAAMQSWFASGRDQALLRKVSGSPASGPAVRVRCVRVSGALGLEGFASGRAPALLRQVSSSPASGPGVWVQSAFRALGICFPLRTVYLLQVSAVPASGPGVGLTEMLGLNEFFQPRAGPLSAGRRWSLGLGFRGVGF